MQMKRKRGMPMWGVIAIRLIVGSSRWPSRPHPWVARITGVDPRFGYAREFVKGVFDYSYSTRATGKNTYLYFNLSPGLYEVWKPVSWKHDERYFCRVENGEVISISKEELDECLKKSTSE